MDKEEKGAVAASAAPVMTADATIAAAKVELATEIAKAAAAERERVKMITAKANKLGLPAEFADDLIDRGVSLEAAAVAMIDKLAERSPQTMAIPASPARVLVDERDTMKVGMASAIAAQLMRKAPDAPQGAAFMGSTLVEMAAACTGHRGSLRTPADKERVLMSAFHATSDFPGLMENALNKTLLTRYAQQTPVYRSIAKRMTFNDFRAHPVLRAGDMPTLQEISTGGEIKAGTFSESKESVVAKSYAVQLPISRQMMINDDLSSIADLLSDQGAMIARFEDTTFFALLLSASGAGPTLTTTGRAVFNTTDASLAGTASTIDLANMSIARAALRKRTGLDGALLDVSPRFLLVGPDRETVAQQILAPVAAQQASNVQVFSDGSVSLLVSSRITGNSWYLFADPTFTPNFVYGFLSGYEAPRVRMDEPFGMQGISYSFEHDFGVGAIDFRGGFRNAGA